LLFLTLIILAEVVVSILLFLGIYGEASVCVGEAGVCVGEASACVGEASVCVVEAGVCVG
jgi:hypothetical protein